MQSCVSRFAASVCTTLGAECGCTQLLLVLSAQGFRFLGIQLLILDAAHQLLGRMGVCNLVWQPPCPHVVLLHAHGIQANADAGNAPQRTNGLPVPPGVPCPP